MQTLEDSRYMYTAGHSRVVSAGTYLPAERVTSRELMQQIDSENRFDISFDWLERTMGIRERRKTPAGLLPSDMAADAALEAIELAGIGASEIDAIIYAGVDRDYYLEPATAHIVQDKIKAFNAVAFDVTNACHGFMNAIHLMDALIATGQARRGLIVAGEQGHRYAEKAISALTRTEDRQQFLKLAGGLTLGDAGAALILGPKLDPDSGFMGLMLQSQGQYSRLCTCGGRGEESALETDMASIVEHGIRLLGSMYKETMRKLGWEPQQIAKFVHHQVGRKVFNHHARYAQISTDIMPDTVTSLGNLVTANIPVNLYNLAISGEMQVGDKVFIAGAGSGLAVSQAGLVWGAA